MATAKVSNPLTKRSVNMLYDMLRTMRPNGSIAEEDYIDKYLVPFKMDQDKYGNLYKRIGTKPVVWSSHTDTVHRMSGTQLIHIDDKYVVGLDAASKSNCLGADDTAGNWLMMEMMRAEVPGLYIFHRAEECGGKGSDWIKDNNADALKDMKCVIALDRRGFDSVITHQWGGRCCSKEFATSLADALNVKTAKFKLDPGGSFTDSANYVGIVGECTNLSVGYFGQHSGRETVHVPFLAAMRELLINLDVDALVYKRAPGEKEVFTRSNYYGCEGYEWGGGHTRHQPYKPTKSWNDHKKDDYWDAGSPNYCPKRVFHSNYFYFVDNVRVPCNKEKWEARVTELEEKIKVAAALAADNKKAVTTTVIPKKHFYMKGGVQVEHTVRSIIDHYPHAIAAMIEAWGLDPALLYECVLEQITAALEKTGSETNNQQQKH